MLLEAFGWSRSQSTIETRYLQGRCINQSLLQHRQHGAAFCHTVPQPPSWVENRTGRRWSAPTPSQQQAQCDEQSHKIAPLLRGCPS